MRAEYFSNYVGSYCNHWHLPWQEVGLGALLGNMREEVVPRYLFV